MAAQSHLENWFKPEALYAKGQPFQTLVKQWGYDHLVRELRKLEPHYSRARSLEVGPGHAPLSPVVGFKSRTYLDVSPAILKKLQEVLDGGGHPVVGRVERIPFGEDEFQVAIASEVLTHVHPRKRPVAVKELARVARKLLIVDRCVAKGQSAAQIAHDLQKHGKLAFSTLLSPKNLSAQLRKLGFRVRVSYTSFGFDELGSQVGWRVWKSKHAPSVRGFPLNFFILAAEKKEGREKPHKGRARA